ncbi:hypothetical protein ASF52_09540 [Methylobacterium sp. Leaf112]|nr:hypothetical protein ASF52_09540 [Methylobacterium sp. Leaf112]
MRLGSALVILTTQVQILHLPLIKLITPGRIYRSPLALSATPGNRYRSLVISVQGRNDGAGLVQGSMASRRELVDHPMLVDQPGSQQAGTLRLNDRTPDLGP